MTLIEVFLLALALGADAFAVGAAVGLEHNTPRQIFRLSWHFGLFQALMPLIGALIGLLARAWIEDWSHWIACALLIGIGVKMIVDSFSKEEECDRSDKTRGLTMVGLSVAVSIDALAAGFSLGVADVSIALAVAIIGLTSTIMTAVAMIGSGRLARFSRGYGERFAGVVLIGLGIKAVWPL